MPELNEAPVLDQLREHWMKVAALVVWKLAGREAVTITAKDLEAFAEATKEGGLMLLTTGSWDNFTFRMVPEEEAMRYAAEEAKRKGTA